MIRKIVPAAALLLGSMSLDAVAQQAKAKYDTWWLPDQAATAAAPIDEQFYLILAITGAVFVIVFVAMAYLMIKYRHRDGRKAVYSHGNNRLEIAWTVAPALILVFLGVISQSVWSDIKQEVPGADTSLVVEVMPRQFQWDIRYAGADGKFRTADDITTINQLHVPLGKAVLLNMSAQDVIHSFFVPEFRMKQDAVPGMLTQYWFTATKTGEYEIACAELCGLGHYRMRGFLTVHPAAEFDSWYSGQIAEKRAQLAPPPAPVATDTTTDASAAGTDTVASGGTSGPVDTAASR